MLKERLYATLFQRSSFPVYKAFGLNSSELWLLSSLYCLQKAFNQQQVSRQELYNELSQNRKKWPKYQGYITGLLRLRLIGSYEYVSQPGSQSYGVSDLGLQALRYHERVMGELMARYSIEGGKMDELLVGADRPRFRQTA